MDGGNSGKASNFPYKLVYTETLHLFIPPLVIISQVGQFNRQDVCRLPFPIFSLVEAETEWGGGVGFSVLPPNSSSLSFFLTLSFWNSMGTGWPCKCLVHFGNKPRMGESQTHTFRCLTPYRLTSSVAKHFFSITHIQHVGHEAQELGRTHWAPQKPFTSINNFEG